MVTFGSSFNVCERQRALNETAHILKPRGGFSYLRNYRDLEDPIQASIEEIIQQHEEGYFYGSHRQNPIMLKVWKWHYPYSVFEHTSLLNKQESR